MLFAHFLVGRYQQPRIFMAVSDDWIIDNAFLPFGWVVFTRVCL